MSEISDYRQKWCEIMLSRAILLFHESRKEEGGNALPLSDLARQCANAVFADNAYTIIGSKEKAARAFMTACREGFAPEIQKALVEAKEPEMMTV